MSLTLITQIAKHKDFEGMGLEIVYNTVPQLRTSLLLRLILILIKTIFFKSIKTK